MEKIIKNDLGTISISNEVIATITGIAATECYGLVGMVSRKMKDGVAELLRRENLGKGVEITNKGDLTIVDLFIVVEYGTKITEVAHNIREKVSYILSEMLDLKSVKVNVNVQSVRVSNVK
jgi:uncharacterized alkaline shock family protein YloU